MDNNVFDSLASLLPILTVAGLFFLLLLALLVLTALKKKRENEYPYSQKPVLTPAEANFFPTLQQCLPEGTYLLSKVRLADFLQVEAEREEYLKFFGRISQKHADFLIVSEVDFEPLLVVELDDSSHRTSKRTLDSDAFKDRAYAAAGIPILRIPAAKNYQVSIYREDIQRMIRHGE